MYMWFAKHNKEIYINKCKCSLTNWHIKAAGNRQDATLLFRCLCHNVDINQATITV